MVAEELPKRVRALSNVCVQGGRPAKSKDGQVSGNKRYRALRLTHRFTQQRTIVLNAQDSPCVETRGLSVSQHNVV